MKDWHALGLMSALLSVAAAIWNLKPAHQLLGSLAVMGLGTLNLIVFVCAMAAFRRNE